MTGRQVALEILTRADKGNGFIDNILELTVSKYRLPERDGRFVREITYGVTKMKKHLDYVIDELSRKRKTRPILRNVLRIGAYQILFMNRVPDYAAVNESVNLLEAKDLELASFVNALLRRIAREGGGVTFPDSVKEPVTFLSTFYSHPEWLIRRWFQRYGYEGTQELCRVNNTAPKTCLRTNTLRISSKELLELFEGEAVQVVPGRCRDYVFCLTGTASLSMPELSSFREGLFQVQDESAVLVGEMLDVKPGEKIVDLCASPGGKSTHLAQLMEDDGLIVAVDVSVARLRPLIENVKRLGIKSIRPVVSDSRYFRAENSDGVLLDVPCSGTGTLRRRADLRWRRSENDIKALSEIQFGLLDNAASWLKVGGRLVYSTCSIEPDENENVIDRFLSTHSNFSFQPILEKFPKEFVRDGYYLTTSPHIHGIDGIFACLLRKTRESV